MAIQEGAGGGVFLRGGQFEPGDGFRPFLARAFEEILGEAGLAGGLTDGGTAMVGIRN